MTGRIADGLILQLADPDLIRWFVSQLREAEAAAGRPAGSVKVQAAAPAHVGPRELGRERTRWFPALVSNHVVDLVNKYPREQLPEALTGYIGNREGYDYHHHAEVGSGERGVRRRRRDGSVLRPRRRRASTWPSCRSWPTPASTSSTST